MYRSNGQPVAIECRRASKKLLLEKRRSRQDYTSEEAPNLLKLVPHNYEVSS